MVVRLVFSEALSVHIPLQLPISLLRTAQNHPMLVELKNGETYNGHLANCDTWMNLHLRDAICTSRVRFFLSFCSSIYDSLPYRMVIDSGECQRCTFEVPPSSTCAFLMRCSIRRVVWRLITLFSPSLVQVREDMRDLRRQQKENTKNKRAREQALKPQQQQQKGKQQKR